MWKAPPVSDKTFEPPRGNSSFSERRKMELAKKRGKKNQRSGMGPGGSAGPTAQEMNQALWLCNAGLWGEAEKLLIELTGRFPRHPFAWNALGALLSVTGRKEAALEPMGRAARLSPMDAVSFYNLGVTQYDLRRLGEAEASYREAVRIKPDYVEAHNNLGVVRRDLGRFDEAEASYREALRIRTDYLEARSNLLLLLSHRGDVSPMDYLAEARDFGRILNQGESPQFECWALDSSPKVLEVGLVSGDFRNHPVGYFIQNLCQCLSDSQIALTAFSTNSAEDELTQRIKPWFRQWQSIEALNDQQAARLIHEAGIHVLIDLSGHTAQNRLGVFALKPAPVQISWLGYWASTGVSQMDYVLSDPIVNPEKDDSRYSESVWRLPETRFCFSPPEADIPLHSRPSSKNGWVTFGCFNNLLKVTDEVVGLWSQILLKKPEAKLFLKANQLAEASMVKQMQKRFQDQGIEAERLILEGPSARSDYLRAYDRMDVALDPFPYTGGTTSAEALWMGVPVLTLKGVCPLSRQGEGLLHNSGLTEWIAHDQGEYLEKALEWASRLEDLNDLSASLRSKIVTRPFFEGNRFARHFEDALWAMWSRHLERNG